ncbi:MAG TPA: cob(I)yrinic acid a,c-diamide adenosyltransferase [Cytophagales bacterium]|nr:cob(I)yrinic acid a,c-diamide adenosyltransferase [Cytophagales bacterium]
MKIYTKSGDEGETSLLGGKKVSKTHERIEAFGSIDELNSYIGLLASYSINNEYQQFLTKQQHILFNLGSQLAIEGKMPDYLPELKTNDITALENEIDDLTKSLPPLRHFILPGGHREVAFCHIARCVCRRAERNVVKVREISHIHNLIIPYLNRLSDYLFVLARKMSQNLLAQEVIWRG